MRNVALGECEALRIKLKTKTEETKTVKLDRKTCKIACDCYFKKNKKTNQIDACS